MKDFCVPIREKWTHQIKKWAKDIVLKIPATVFFLEKLLHPQPLGRTGPKHLSPHPNLSWLGQEGPPNATEPADCSLLGLWDMDTHGTKMTMGTWAELSDMARQSQVEWRVMGKQRGPEKKNKMEIRYAKKSERVELTEGSRLSSFLPLRGLAVLCILFLDINQSPWDIHPVTPAHVGLQSTATRVPNKNRHEQAIHKKG